MLLKPKDAKGYVWIFNFVAEIAAQWNYDNNVKNLKFMFSVIVQRFSVEKSFCMLCLQYVSLCVFDKSWIYLLWVEYICQNHKIVSVNVMAFITLA